MVHFSGIMIIHSPHPVRQPSSTNLKKHKFDFRVPFHDPATNQGHDSNHQIKRHSHGVNVEIRIFKFLLPRTVVTTCDPVDTNRSSEIICLSKEFVEMRVV